MEGFATSFLLHDGCLDLVPFAPNPGQLHTLMFLSAVFVADFQPARWRGTVALTLP